MSRKDATKAHRTYDAFATAALDLGFAEEEITVCDFNKEIHLRIEHEGRDCSIRVAKDGIGRTVRSLADQTDWAARCLAVLLPGAEQRLADPEPEAEAA